MFSVAPSLVMLLTGSPLHSISKAPKRERERVGEHGNTQGPKQAKPNKQKQQNFFLNNILKEKKQEKTNKTANERLYST
jgi:hypothetical protein